MRQGGANGKSRDNARRQEYIGRLWAGAPLVRNRWRASLPIALKPGRYASDSVRRCRVLPCKHRYRRTFRGDRRGSERGCAARWIGERLKAGDTLNGARSDGALLAPVRLSANTPVYVAKNSFMTGRPQDGGREPWFSRRCRIDHCHEANSGYWHTLNPSRRPSTAHGRLDFLRFEGRRFSASLRICSDLPISSQSQWRSPPEWLSGRSCSV